MIIYPIQIENEPQLMRLISTIVKSTVKEMNPEKKKAPLMSKQDCYHTKGVGRVLVDRAITNGTLPLHCIEGRACIKTKDFEEWLSKDVSL